MVETLLSRVQRGEWPKVDKTILNVSVTSGRIEDKGQKKKKMEEKGVVYIGLSFL